MAYPLADEVVKTDLFYYNIGKTAKKLPFQQLFKIVLDIQGLFSSSLMYKTNLTWI